MLQLAKPLILGSKSPRRKQLLSELDVQFNVITKSIEEKYSSKKLKPVEVPNYLASIKNQAFASEKKTGNIVLTADTVVILDGKILNKPHNEDDAKSMLSQLSERQHQVVTACVLANDAQQIHFSDMAEVHFQRLTEQEIDYYISKYLLLDKAGSYGIQDWLGLVAIKKIVGSYYTVMGLPTHLVFEKLKQFIK